MKRIIIYFLVISFFSSCDNFLEIGPNKSELDSDILFENDNTAIVALEAVYHELQAGGFASGDVRSITSLGNTLTDDSADYNNTTDWYQFYLNNIRSDNDTNYNIWRSTYSQLYNLNSLLKGIENNAFLLEKTIQRIEGEAKFIRAFIYYYLVHLYGEVPIVTSIDYSINQSLERSPINEVYRQIQRDLEEAIDYLPEDYAYSEGEHIRPTKYAAYVLLSRLALYEKEYAKTIEYADRIIDSGQYELTELNEVFKANSSESIWQLLPVVPSTGANEGAYFILENNPEAPGAISSQALTNDFLSIWEPGDLRYSNWINVYSEGNKDYYYPFKYKIKYGGDSEEYSMVMRLGEVYLIRAEAYAMQGEVAKALADLNVIRNRAGLPDLTATDVTDIKEMVLEERRRELFSEWGHRWLDLKRFGKIDEVLGAIKPQWSPHAKLLPIPEQDLLRNPFLTQNPGY